MSSRERKVFDRSSKGLFDYIMSSLEDMRDGVITPQEMMSASEGALAANTVLNDDVNRDLKKVAFRLAAKERLFTLKERRHALLEHKREEEGDVVDVTPVAEDWEDAENLLREATET